MINIKITGVPEFQGNLKNLVKPDDIKKLFIKTGFKIEHDAKRLFPVDTGRLRSSISTNWDDSGMGRARVAPPSESNDGVSQPSKRQGEICVVRVGSNVEYAPYIEYGTRKMSPQPFLEPSIKGNISGLITALNNYINLKK